MARSDVSFEVGGTPLAAWLYRPDGERDGAAPLVVLAHGFTGVREQRLDAYAERFAAAGIAALVFDYRHFGASGGGPRQLLDVGRQLQDWRAAVATARALPGIDPARIALWGSSFSGGHVVAIAAGDPEIAAVVSQAPFTDGLSAVRAGGLRQAARLTAAGLRDQAAALAGRKPVLIPAVGMPGELAAMTAREAYPGFHSIDPPHSSWQNAFTPRVMLRLLQYRPYAKFAKLRCPVLVCVCLRDAITPHAPAVRAAERSPNAELRSYDIGHFDIYTGEHFERAAGDQAEFLARNLVGGRAAAAATAG